VGEGVGRSSTAAPLYCCSYCCIYGCFCWLLRALAHFSCPASLGAHRCCACCVACLRRSPLCLLRHVQLIVFRAHYQVGSCWQLLPLAGLLALSDYVPPTGHVFPTPVLCSHCAALCCACLQSASCCMESTVLPGHTCAPQIG
jgi:hypothetical protein